MAESGKDKTPSILIVEDEKIVALDLTNTLIQLGYNIIGDTSTAEEAIELASKHNPDLILMDILLEGPKKGTVAAKEIYYSFGIPIIFLTAYSDEQNLLEAKESYPFGVLLKPFEEKELKINIDFALQKAKLEKKIKESKNLLKGILENVDEAILTTDIEGKINYFNTPSLKYLNEEPSKITGLPVYDALPVEKKTFFRESVLNFLKGIQKERVTFYSAIRDHITGVSRINIKPHFTGDNQVKGVIVSILDITADKDIIQELHDNREKYEALLESCIEAIFMMDPETGKILEANHSFYEVTGYEESDLSRLTLYDIIDDEKNRVAENLWKIMSQGSYYIGERIWKKKSGGKFYVDVSTSLIRMGGKPVIYVVARDITEKRRYEINLEKFRSIVEKSHDFIGLASLDEKVVYVNEYGKKLVGLENGIDHKDFKIKEFSDQKTYEAIKNVGFPKTLEDGFWNMEGKLKNFQTGELIDVDISLFLVKDPDSHEPLFFGSIQRDIRINKKVRNEIKNKNLELQKLNNELDTFVKQVAHDLRSPLSSISGILEIIGIKDKEKEGISEDLKYIEKSINRLDAYILNLLSITREKDMKVRVEEIDLEEIINECLHDLKYMDAQSEIEIRKDFQINRPVFTDPYRIKLIMKNLISNSIKYKDPAKDRLVIIITTWENAGNIYISIEDNGLGIPGKYRQEIFNMFFRAHSHQSGTGLGLYLVRGTLERLGGKITLESNENEFTRFLIQIPDNKG